MEWKRRKKLKAIQRKYDEWGEGSKENGRLKKNERENSEPWRKTLEKYDGEDCDECKWRNEFKNK